MNASNSERSEVRRRLEGRRGRLLQTLRRMWRHGLEDAETGGIGELSLYDQHPADLGAELNARQVDFGLQQNMERMLEQVEKALRRIEAGSYGTCENCGRQIDKERLEAMPYVTLCIDCQRDADGSGPEPPGRSNGVHETSPGPEPFQEGKIGVDERSAGEGTRHFRADRFDAQKGAPRRGSTLEPSREYARPGPGDARRPVEELSLEPPFGRTFRDGDDYAAYDGEDAWQDVARYGTSNTPQDVPPAVDYDDVYIDAGEIRGAVTPADAIEDLSGQGVSIPEIYPDPEHEEDELRPGL